MNDVRTEVWDHLHKNGSASTATIATALGQTIPTIQTAIDHEWFDVQGDVVGIAVCEAPDAVADHAAQCSEAESHRRLRQMFPSDE